MCQDLSAEGANPIELMVTGRWRIPAMSMRYIENVKVERGAVAAMLRYYQKRGDGSVPLEAPDC